MGMARAKGERKYGLERRHHPVTVIWLWIGKFHESEIERSNSSYALQENLR